MRTLDQVKEGENEGRVHVAGTDYERKGEDQMKGPPVLGLMQPW